jgi:YVTN family beta-propeller protein
MRFTQRRVILIGMAMAGLAPAGIVVAAAPSASAGAVAAHAGSHCPRVTATITVGRFPGGVAVNPATGTVYVANRGGTVSVINGHTNTVVATIAVGQARSGLRRIRRPAPSM